ncbi:MAG: MFS transporter [Leptospiraceae bacterium]|nr:MFS transporter [Leptospiraceae bacterium]
MLKYIGLGDLSEKGSRAILAFWMIIGMAFFLFGDQNLIAPNLKNIAGSFGITEQSDIDWYIGGIIPIAFFILGGIVSVSMGYFSQKYSRKNLLLISVLMGEIPCFLTAYSNSYQEFFFYRTLCGFGLGGVFPILFSIVGDYFSTRSRVTATAYVSLAMGLGIGVGQMVGGILGEHDPLNGWRTSFVYMSVPSFFFALIYFLFCEEPKRGGSELEFQDVSDEKLEKKLNRKDIVNIFSSPTNLGILFQGIPGCVPWGVFFVYLVDYYESVYGLSKTLASGYLTVAGVGIMIGTFLGGIIGQWLYNKKKVLQPIFAASSIFIGIIPCYFLLHSQEIAQSALFLGINFLTGIIITLPMSNVRSILINTNEPKNRSTAFAVYNLTDDLGKGLGPAISALILGLIPDRSTAFTVSILFWLPCSLFWIPVILNYANDEERVRQRMTLEVKNIQGSL